MIRKLAGYAKLSAVLAVLTALFTVVDVSSKAMASELQRRPEARAVGAGWIEAIGVSAMLGLGLAATIDTFKPTSTLHTAWAGGSLVVYPGDLGNAREFYVDGTNGDDDYSGLTWDQAKATIQAGVDLTTSGQGDRVFIRPKATAYVENVTIDAKDYVHLIGVLVPGYARPDIVPAAGIGVKVTNSQGVVLSHVRAVGTTQGGHIEGNGFLLNDSVFEGATDGLLLVGDTTDDTYTASEGIIRECWIRDSGTGLRFKNPGPTAGVGATDVKVLDCYFYGNTNEDVIDEDTAGSNDQTFGNGLIHGCKFLTRNKAVYITLSNGGGNTGMISGNFFAEDVGLDATKIDLATGIVFAGNFQAAGVVNGAGF